MDNLVDSERYRYRDFPSAVGANGQSWQLLVALVLVGALLAAMWWWRGERVEPQVSGPSVAVGVGLAAMTAAAALVVVDPGWDREPSAAGFAVGCAAVVVGLTAGWRVGRPALAVWLARRASTS
ncbi:hypothetical protein [Nocardia otitidiscaviarum]|uniref:hypothetical protein n=1 Tax=Nocardia otitidiscaviarum TaxID=1823 RepID=UPI0018963262|nr:hypothetical protein [Nocardia otitidiscaviarum]MBF6181194.1 hypothetical protein [Nocardia otitidiscaviarum]